MRCSKAFHPEQAFPPSPENRAEKNDTLQRPAAAIAAAAAAAFKRGDRATHPARRRRRDRRTRVCREQGRHLPWQAMKASRAIIVPVPSSPSAAEGSLTVPSGLTILRASWTAREASPGHLQREWEGRARSPGNYGGERFVMSPKPLCRLAGL